MRKTIIVALAALGILAASVGTGRTVARASGNCTYAEHKSTINHVKNLTDGNYVDEVLSVWMVPQSGCTEWAGHHFGDTQIEVAYELGTTADRFYLSSGIDPEAFGWDQETYGNSPPMGSGTCDLGACPFYWNTTGPFDWTAPVSGTAGWFDVDALGGTNGDTTVYTASDSVQLVCPNGSLGVGVSDWGVAGQGNTFDSHVDISGTNSVMPENHYNGPWEAC